MKTSLVKVILAVIALERDLVLGGGTPVFYAKSKEEQEQMATTLGRVMEGVVHKLENGLLIIVKH